MVVSDYIAFDLIFYLNGVSFCVIVIKMNILNLTKR